MSEVPANVRRDVIAAAMASVVKVPGDASGLLLAAGPKHTFLDDLG